MSIVPSGVSQKVARIGLVAAKNSPQTLFGLGVAGVIGSTVLACRATLKLEGILETGANDLRIAKSIEDEGYTEKDLRHDTALIYIQTAAKVGKQYAPAIIVGGLSIAALTRSHRILTERNAALTAAYIALEQGFDQYRARVVEKYGEEADRNMRYGTRVEEITDDKGRTKKVTRAALTESSIYAKWFDSNSSSWNHSGAEYNYIFLKNQQRYMNDLLRARGHVMLNDVYDELGIERTTAGAVVGWVLNNREGGDNYIDFGIFDENSDIEDFVYGPNNAILLDFNVDGLVYDKIDSPREDN